MVCNPRKGKQIRHENIDSKLYPLSFKGFKHLHSAENEKHFKEPKIKSGSSHLGTLTFVFLSFIYFVIFLLKCWISDVNLKYQKITKY
jgi:hypothetical protein